MKFASTIIDHWLTQSEEKWIIETTHIPLEKKKFCSTNIDLHLFLDGKYSQAKHESVFHLQ